MKCNECQARKPNSRPGGYHCSVMAYGANDCPYGKKEPDETINDPPPNEEAVE